MGVAQPCRGESTAGSQADLGSDFSPAALGELHKFFAAHPRSSV